MSQKIFRAIALAVIFCLYSMQAMAGWVYDMPVGCVPEGTTEKIKAACQALCATKSGGEYASSGVTLGGNSCALDEDRPIPCRCNYMK